MSTRRLRCRTLFVVVLLDRLDRVSVGLRLVDKWFQLLGVDSNEEQAPALLGNPVIMWSSEEQNRRGHYYCVYGACRTRGELWLDTNSNTPGGP